jgi:hypothetical protein
MRMMKTVVLAVALVLAMVGAGSASEVTPSDNDTNRENGWAHFNVLDTRVGEVDVEFVSTRSFASCFEFRSDGAPTTDERDNFNDDIHDGLWPFVCVNNSTQTRTLTAEEYVEIRMVFGAETDERFDWTRVEVLPQPQPETAEDCKGGGFADFGFRNQGQCVRYVNTGQDSR